MADVFADVTKFVESLKSEADQLSEYDYRETLANFLPDMEGIAQDSFNRQREPSGRKWEEWHWTPYDVFKSNPDHPTLEITGSLKRSTRLGGPDNIAEVKSHSVSFGSNLPYAGTHNVGKTIRTNVPLISRSGKGWLIAGSTLVIPRRQYLAFTQDNIDDFANRILDRIIEILKDG